MPAASKTSASSGGTMEPKSDTLQLASALNEIAKKADQWFAAIDHFKSLQSNLANSIEVEITAKKRSLETLGQEYEQEKRQKRICMEQELQEFGIKATEDILKQRGDTSLSILELTTLREKVATQDKLHAEQLKLELEQEREKYNTKLANVQQTLQLEHAKEAAELKAQANGLQAQLTLIKDELKKAESRLDAQRELCQKIAESSRQPSIVQNMAK
jgi:hypothetical protein